MAFQVSVTVQNGRLDAFEAAIGASPIMKIFTGSPPADCATADSGTVLATLTLPSDWMASAAANSKSKSGTWEDSEADATGVAGYFRIYDSSGTVCHAQGTVTMPGGGGDMIVINTSFAVGQPLSVTSFDLADGNS